MSNTLSPPSFPGRPATGGPLNKAAPLMGEWFFEPKENEFCLLVHPLTRTVFNRHGQPAAFAKDITDALHELFLLRQPIASEFAITPEDLWLHGGFLGKRHNIGKNSIVIFDVVTPRLTYTQRRYGLNRVLKTRPIGVQPEKGQVYLVASYPQGEARWLWNELLNINQSWHPDAIPANWFYEGVVAKKCDSVYPIQLVDPKRETLDWLKMRYWSEVQIKTQQTQTTGLFSMARF